MASCCVSVEEAKDAKKGFSINRIVGSCGYNIRIGGFNSVDFLKRWKSGDTVLIF